MKINVRLIAALELQSPTHGVVNFAVGDDLLDRDPGLALLELRDGRVQYRAFAFGGERVREAQPLRTRLSQGKAMTRQRQGHDHDTTPKPDSRFQINHSGGA